MPHAHRLRFGRHSEPGRVYLVTFTTHRRNRLFADWTLASTASRVLASADAWAGSRLLCWVLMPDHFHGLLELGDVESLASNVGRAKHQATRALHAAGLDGPAWARGFHDRALRSDDNVIAAARYIIANPLRAGLADTVGAYPFWDAVWLDRSTPV